VLTALFSVHGERDQTSYCIVQMYEPMDNFGIPILNEFDCPLFSLTNLFRCVVSNSILQSVSIIHECTSSCMLKRVNTASQVEREVVVEQKLQFEHDYCNNNLYSCNMYCLHSSHLFLFSEH